MNQELISLGEKFIVPGDDLDSSTASRHVVLEAIAPGEYSEHYILTLEGSPKRVILHGRDSRIEKSPADGSPVAVVFDASLAQESTLLEFAANTEQSAIEAIADEDPDGPAAVALHEAGAGPSPWDTFEDPNLSGANPFPRSNGHHN